jgi:hypothetical protein
MENRMELVSQETLNQLIQGSESLLKVAAGTSTVLMNEAINLFIVEAVLSILKFSVIFVIFFIVKKYCDTMMGADSEKNGLFKAFKTTALVLSLIFFTTQSFPHVLTISKALVAPKIFLLEKSISIGKSESVNK